MPSKPSRDTLIHCAACGEDYSATYRRCPFCGERNDPRRTPARGEAPPPPARGREEEEPDDGFVFSGQDAFDDAPEEEYYAPRPKGGKRLAPKSGGGFDLPPVNWPRLITFLCSLVIIVAALVIVFTFIYPQLHGKQEPKPEGSPSLPPASQGLEVDPTPGASQPAVSADPVPPPTVEPDPVVPALSAIVLKNSDGMQVTDITLRVGSSAQLTAEFTPAGWAGQVTWSSTNPEYITVSDTGYVTNVNNSGAFHNVYITAEADGVSVQCIVRALAGDTPVHSAPPPSDSQPPASQEPGGNQTSGGVTVGRSGTIVNAEGGLRVRSGPGTSYEILDSLVNGNPVQVVAAAENGWYQISYSGAGGATMYGYVLGDYISTD